MPKLINIFSKIEPGDKVLVQHKDDAYSKPKLFIIVGVDVWDMAAVVYYTDYKEFRAFNLDGEEPKIHSFPEWSTYWNILGHWKRMPTFRNLIKAYRKAKPYETRS